MTMACNAFGDLPNLNDLKNNIFNVKSHKKIDFNNYLLLKKINFLRFWVMYISKNFFYYRRFVKNLISFHIHLISFL